MAGLILSEFHKTEFYENKSFFKWSRSHDQDDCYAQVW